MKKKKRYGDKVFVGKSEAESPFLDAEGRVSIGFI
jgi:hypothetical protein